MRLRCASLRSDAVTAVTAVRSRGLAATAWRSTARHRASGHATDAPGHRANVAATVRGRLLSSLRAPLPNLAAKIDGRACESLNRRGYAVVDGFLGETWCHLLRAVHESWLRDDIITLAERRLLGRNATHLVRRGTTQLLVKNNIFETEIGAHEEARHAAPHLASLYEDSTLRDRLRACVGGPLRSQSLKVQLNHGNGGCFPLHFDGDPALDDRVITAVLYLNPDWAGADGGHLQLVPFPERPVDVAPRFDRLVLFASHDTLHRALPSQNVRFCVTLWFYRTKPGGGAALDDDAKAERRLMARYAYREAWARSIEESHAPGTALDAALLDHDNDTLKIAEALKARGVDLAELDAMIIK